MSQQAAIPSAGAHLSCSPRRHFRHTAASDPEASRCLLWFARRIRRLGGFSACAVLSTSSRPEWPLPLPGWDTGCHAAAARVDASAADCRSSSSWIWRDTASGGGSASSAAYSWEVEDEARGAPLKVPCTWKIAKRARPDNYFRAAEQNVCPSVHANAESFSFYRCKAYTGAAWHPSDHCHSRPRPTIIRLGAMLFIGFLGCNSQAPVSANHEDCIPASSQQQFE